MTPSIVWLTISRAATSAVHRTNHYVLKVQNKYMVFTTKNVPGADCVVISQDTIDKKTKGPQFLAQKVHTIDPSTHFTHFKEQGAAYLAKYGTELQPYVEKLQPIVEKLT